MKKTSTLPPSARRKRAPANIVNFPAAAWRQCPCLRCAARAASSAPCPQRRDGVCAGCPAAD